MGEGVDHGAEDLVDGQPLVFNQRATDRDRRRGPKRRFFFHRSNSPGRNSRIASARIESSRNASLPSINSPRDIRAASEDRRTRLLTIKTLRCRPRRRDLVRKICYQ